MGPGHARTVTLRAAQITDRIEPEAPLYTVDGQKLEPGQSQQVEWQKAGVTVVITRTIVENDIPRTDTRRSQYQPWRAVDLVGTGTPLSLHRSPNEEATSAAICSTLQFLVERRCTPTEEGTAEMSEHARLYGTHRTHYRGR
jgi:hypothetical protein